MTLSSADTPSIVALIPARSGSVRLTDKNVLPLAGHPVLAYTIAAARASGIFSAVILSTDSEKYAAIGRHYGAEIPFLRPAEFATETSPDFEWIKYTLHTLADAGRSFDCFSILRPTSPLRRPETIQRAWSEFRAETGIDSLRAVEKVRQHPGKMWVIRGRRMIPLLPLSPPDRPWHSQQYQALPEVYTQNAALEIAWSRVVFDTHTIAGQVIMPFFTVGNEGLDINSFYDWERLNALLAKGEVVLPALDRHPYANK